MALFKILNNIDSKNALPTTATKGYCYFDATTNLFYIDIKDGTNIQVTDEDYRVPLNAAKAAYSSVALKDFDGNVISETYLNNLVIGGTVLSATRPDGSQVDIQLPQMTGANSTTPGNSGFVPAPPSGGMNYFLRGSGAWAPLSASINGTVFDGVNNITTANWGSARNISIADSDMSHTGAITVVNGSKDITLVLPETISADTTGSAGKVAHTLTINGFTFNGSEDIGVGVIKAQYGGTGQSTLVDSANALINALTTKTDTLTDNDYIIAQYAGGGTTTTTYHRYAASRLWNYIKSKADSTYAAKSHTHAIADITNLQTTLDGKAATNHTHNYAGASSAGGAATSADKVNSNLIIKLNSGSTEGTNLFTFNGSAAKTINLTAAAIGAAASSHTHNYAGSSSAGGAANSVANSFIVKLNGGSTEGTNLFTFNGSAAKTVNITASAIGAAASSHTHNYAGSSSAGGAANSANKLNTNAGSASQPVYFANGIPVAITGTIANNVASANKVNHTLSFTVGGVSKGSFDGSADHTVDVNAMDLNISSALTYLGRTSSTPTSATVTLTSGKTVTATAGNVVICTADNKEYLYDDDGTWVDIGGSSSYSLKPHIHGNIDSAGFLTSDLGVAQGNKLVRTDSTGKIIAGLSFGTGTTKFLAENGTWQTSGYHKTGSWNDLTYTATAVNGAEELKFTLPTGTSGTTLALGNHSHDSTYVLKAGDTMTGGLVAPSLATGSDAANYFQTRKFRGEGTADTYYHAIDFGYSGHNQVDFHEYGGIWNFYKNTAGTSSGGTLVASIQSDGFHGALIGNAQSASKVTNNLIIKLNSGSTEGTNLFTFNGSVAKTVNITPSAIGAAASSHTHSYLPLSGGTLTGTLTLKADPTANLQAATKQYVDNKVSASTMVRQDTTQSAAAASIAVPTAIQTALNNGGTLMVYQEGLLLLPTINYTIASGNGSITLVGYSCEAGDTFTFCVVPTGLKLTDLSSGVYVPLAGGTMTGALTLSGDPTMNLQAATKQYVDNAAPDLSGYSFLPSKILTTTIDTATSASSYIITDEEDTEELKNGKTLIIKIDTTASSDTVQFNYNNSGYKQFKDLDVRISNGGYYKVRAGVVCLIYFDATNDVWQLLGGPQYQWPIGLSVASTSGSKYYVMSNTSVSNYNTNTMYGLTSIYYNTSGELYTSKTYGAVWNDYAEYREANTIIPGKCVVEVGDDTLIMSTTRMLPGASIISDTYGFAIGETEESKTPIAVSGRVLAYPYENREEFKKAIGRPVCSGPDGTVSIMSDEEYAEKGYCAIGIISAVPDYETWGTGNVPVNGRVWIKVI